MKSIILKTLLFFLILTLGSSCFTYTELRTKGCVVWDKRLSRKYGDGSTPVITFGFFWDSRTDREHRKKETTIKLRYYFKIPCGFCQSAKVKLLSFSLTKKNGDTIPCIFYYGKTALYKPSEGDTLYYQYADSLIYKADTLPLYIDMHTLKGIEGVPHVDIVAHTEEFAKRVDYVCVSYEIIVDNMRFVAKNVEYKRKHVTENLLFATETCW